MHNSEYVVTHVKDGNISSELKAQWLKLAQGMQNPSFIHDVHWYTAYLNSNPDTAQTCHILKLAYHDQPIAIFPLQYITNKRFGLNLRTWRIFWPNDMGINDFILLEPLQSHKYIKVLMEYLNSNKDFPWDLLELQNVPENAAIADVLKYSPNPRAVSIYHHDSKYLVCRSSYEESMANISSKFKKNNRRKQRNLEKLGKVTTSYVNKPEDLKQAFEAFLEVEAANWKGEQNSALRDDERQRRFYLELLNEHAHSGNCVIHLLKLDGIPIAAQFALISGNTLFLLKIGYNAEYHAMGPGGLLLDETLRRCSGDPVIKHISFITGAKWNDDWAPRVHRVYNHYLYNRTFKGLAAWFAERAKSGLRTIKHKLKA
jgi:CelD/BcsL family acetyltransferase involved in cellulose biosynthesis